jgi:hypothetical protein
LMHPFPQQAMASDIVKQQDNQQQQVADAHCSAAAGLISSMYHSHSRCYLCVAQDNMWCIGTTSYSNRTTSTDTGYAGQTCEHHINQKLKNPWSSHA